MNLSHRTGTDPCLPCDPFWIRLMRHLASCPVCGAVPWDCYRARSLWSQFDAAIHAHKTGQHAHDE